MGHEIDMKNSNMRTDLALELLDKKPSRVVDDIRVTDIVLNKEDGLKIGKKEGRYITIEFKDVTDSSNEKKVCQVFKEELKKIIKDEKIGKDDLCLIIGLGNEKSTADALGPLVVSETLVTNYLYLYDSLEEGFRRTCALSPGVMGETGIETSDLLLSIVKCVKPDFVIVIDALCASSIERVNKTIQMTTAGINPGSGVGNKRKEISKDILGVPTIAIGIPTVVDAVSIVSDTIRYLYKHIGYQKENINNPMSKLSYGVNYLNKDYDIKKEDREKVFGMIGSLSDDETKKLIYEILTPTGYNMIVTPKEEDFVISKLALVISSGLNDTLHTNHFQ